MTSVFSVINTYDPERPVFMREHSNHMYRTSAYYFSKVITELPFQIFFPALFATITYWMIGFKDNVWIYVLVMLAIILTSNVGAALGFAIAVIAPSGAIATAVSPALILPFVIFSGFFINNSSTPVYFIWIPYISFVNYAFRIVVTQVFKDQTFTCDSSDPCTYPNGEAVIESLDFDGNSLALDFSILAAMYVFFRLLAFIGLWVKANRGATNV